VDAAEFARICLALQERGAENINIVTGSHAVPALVEGIAAARSGQAGFPGRLTVPVLWNSSAYELPETLEFLAGQADVFLPDLKTLDRAAAARYFHAPDYPEIAPAAIEKMLSLRPLRFAGAPAADPQAGIAAETAVNAAGQARLVSGVLIRHLVLPGCLPASRAVLRWFADHCAGRALLSVMFQYTPVGPAGPGYPPGGPRRTVSGEEYETVLGWLEEFSIEDGYCQELVSGNLPLPDFNRPGPFPAGLAVPVWHWRTGFV
jgi:putative pyruvate formate lyase activating enzyme